MAAWSASLTLHASAPLRQPRLASVPCSAASQAFRTARTPLKRLPSYRHASAVGARDRRQARPQAPFCALLSVCKMAQYSTRSDAGAPSVTQIATHNQYHSDGIDTSSLLPSPIAQFNKWFKEALDRTDVQEPEAMTICTVSLPPSSSSDFASAHSSWRGAETNAAPRPSARVVLLKGVDPSGFVFYSNYTSRKGEELARNPWISATFYWRALHRSVRICGKAERVTKAESQAYFHSRPIGSRIGARASPQSRVIKDREQLEALVREEEQKCSVPGAAGLNGEEVNAPDAKIEVPHYWGGYRIIPDEVEFWCGRNNRLHDRFRYTRANMDKAADEDQWTVERLAP
ncbi:pyridoxamine 5'-phosphate oxidase [Tilletiaria anomala UBC 951]|uniref:pyridoxal 5'-phosphate synthase n=1 Tax=Tilletiaria anomala (strain ATCC 24038 / CBS 436.72 / UBC 951) TaxID=1037660 RepID=A0A066VAH3_TILAU|nr:pyridoxamine 5'-phosphate oxidase [Tilletiaria anomala UBC 951]KDN38456.1 pyridoxamine 5'-phosphate oxidase [Tilletiaria anomala UBC 951]